MMPSITKHPGSTFANGATVWLPAMSILLFLLCGSASEAAGFRQLTSRGVQFGTWYPTDVPSVKQRLGPFEATMAKDAPVRAGQHQIVLFSHGNGGRYRNHYLTAQTLAEAGYIVIAPQHQADYLVGSRKTAAALDHRYLELELALNAVRANPDFGPYLVPGPAHGVGYSLGGFTIMLAAGAEFDSKKAARHCDQNGRQDPGFCENPGFISRMVQSFRHDVNLRFTADPFRHDPIVTGKAVLIAPVYQGLEIGVGLSIADLTVIAVTGDKIAQPHFHAEPLQQTAGIHVPSRLKTIKGHHYAFISPFPKWLTDQEEIPVARDPEGFDRPAFLKAVNAMILEAISTPTHYSISPLT